MKEFIFDIEANGLKNPTKIWCIVLRDIKINKVYSFTNRHDFEVWWHKQPKSMLIGHNIIEYDLPILENLWHIQIDYNNIIDTLILSRLYKPKLEGGHSLESWGERLDFPKYEFNDFSKYTDEMLIYCQRDVDLNTKVYKELRKIFPELTTAVKLEHKIAVILRDAREYGFYFDLNKAIDLKVELEKHRDKYNELIHKTIPTIIKEEIFIPKRDNAKKGYQAGVPFIKKHILPFNPNSSQQCIDYILIPAGWKPYVLTDGHKKILNDPPQDLTKEELGKKKERFNRYGYKLNEENLATVSKDNEYAEIANILLKRLIYETRVRKLTEWINLVSEDDGCIHGNINGLGASTHRMVHNNPNLANIAAKKSIKYHSEELANLVMELGGRMRELWLARPGRVLVGTDAEGIQLRVLAHYMEDKEFIHSVTEGSKDNETDPHSLNCKRIGMGTRDNAKTFIYAFLLGAGDSKIGEIYNAGKSAGKELKENFIKSTPGLSKLKKQRIPTEARRGYTIGFDGRKIYCDDPHLMMAMYLQGGEAVIMKLALYLSITEIKELNLDARLVNVVHDEMLFDCLPEHAERVKEITERSIAEAGELLQLKCPMKGEGKIGTNWLEVH